MIKTKYLSTIFSSLETKMQEKDEKIDELNTMLIDALQKLSEAQTNASLSTSWSKGPGNV